jgi:dATP/dGTP diphosphohydrolase
MSQSSEKNEKDPLGKGAHEAGAKLDAGKIRADLVLGGFSRALKEVAKVGTFGANKYSPNGWKSVPNGRERYSDAMLRHWLDESRGEAVDRESGILHAAHLAWNALARLELMIQEEEFTDALTSVR